MRWPRRRRAVYPPAGAPTARPSWVRSAVPPGSAVRLSFADGSELALPEADPMAIALRAVADLLVQATPTPAEN